MADPEVLRYYALGLEKDRLDEAYLPLERARTRELLLCHLPPPPGVILDVGGAAGAYAFWLADGARPHLLAAGQKPDAESGATGKER